MGPNTAFLLLFVGLLGVYWEFTRPGRIFPGLVGLALSCSGTYWLWRNVPTGTGMLLLITAVCLLSVESIWGGRFIPGIFGTICLAAGFWVLFQPAHRIAPGLAIPVSILAGAASVFLALCARKARSNKRSDL